MAEKVRVGARGEIVLPEKLAENLYIEYGAVLEIKETKEGLLLKPFNPVAELKGLGRGIFRDPLDYQKRIRDE